MVLGVLLTVKELHVPLQLVWQN